MLGKRYAMLIILALSLLSACDTTQEPTVEATRSGVVLQPTRATATAVNTEEAIAITLPPTSTVVPPTVTTTATVTLAQFPEPKATAVAWPHGPRDSWYATNVEPGAVLHHEGQFHLFFNGLANWPAPNAIGYATSPDGLTWTLAQDEPILDTSQTAVPGFTFFVSSALVEADGTWVLYFYTLDEPHDQAIGNIGRATAPAPTGPWTVDKEFLLTPGLAGSWDAHRVTQPSVVQTSDGYVMYYAGFTDGSSHTLRQIGLATSADGRLWTKHPTPVLTIATGDAWDDQRIFQPHVVRTDEGWLMLYKANKGFLQGQGYGLALSKNGIDWVKYDGNPLIDSTNLSGFTYNWFADLLYHDNTLYIFIELLRGRTSDVNVIAFEGLPALSNLPVTDPPIVIPGPFTYVHIGQVLPLGEAGTWDDGAIYIPEVHYFDGRFHMFYSGFADPQYREGAIGYASSEDGIHWTKYENNPILVGLPDTPKVQSAAVLQDGEQWRMFVDATTANSTASGHIYQATAPAPTGPWTLNPEPITGPQSLAAWNRITNPSAAFRTEESYQLYYFAWGSSLLSLGLATSPDGQTWTLHDDPTTTDDTFAESDPVLVAGETGAWDQQGVSVNGIMQTAVGYELFYTGFSVNPVNSFNSAPHNIGYASSEDGLTWTKHPANPIIPLPEETIWPAVGNVLVDDTYYIYYDLRGGRGGIGLIMAQRNELPSASQN